MNFLELTDFEKWSRFKNGDNVALSGIYKENATKLYQYGLKFTADFHQVEDSIHDLFHELIKNRKRLGNTDNILFYLLKSFKRELVRKLLMENRKPSAREKEEAPFGISYSIEHEIIAEEKNQHQKNLLLKALHTLTSRQKEAVYLRFTRELNYSEVSAIMGISVEACRNLVSGAVKTMKETLKAPSDF